MTDVYIYCREEAPLPESLAALLPTWRRERLEKLRYPIAREESLAAGLLYVFALTCRGLPSQEPVAFLPAGKPVFAGRDDVSFSLSHSGAYVLCAVSGAVVGVDVQKIREVNLSLARRFHSKERDWIWAQRDPTQAFFRVWTRKEAWVKAVSRERILSLSEENVTEDLPEFQFYDLPLGTAYQAAVCTSRREEFSKPTIVKRAELLAVL